MVGCGAVPARGKETGDGGGEELRGCICRCWGWSAQRWRVLSGGSVAVLAQETLQGRVAKCVFTHACVKVA